MPGKRPDSPCEPPVEGGGSLPFVPLRYRAWGRALLEPRTRFLPALGARLGTRPRLAARVLGLLHAVPGARLGAFVYRNVSSPLCERLGGAIEVPVLGDGRMIVDTSDPIGRTIAASGVWEPGVTALFHGLLSPGDVCIDVGANVGYYTLLASRLVGPAGHVYALEPAPSAFIRLNDNLALNGVSNVTALATAAGAEEGHADLYSGSGNVGMSSIRHAHETWTATRVTVRPLPALVDPSELARVRLVKIDVEGFEVEVLRGLEPAFARGFAPAFIVELHTHRAPEAAPFIDAFARRHGLTAYRLAHARGAPRRVPPFAQLRLVRLAAGGLAAGEGQPNVLLTPSQTLRRRTS
jgi:FkbM family methyltransferase